ncbi:hypothetical protein ASE85_02515 [Sphingobium sp. Leaf26]|uniref:phage tailspike polysaccharide lyase family protein n=1 Tax=Sphingobium sp. Leaf26 TaxID=1735693 RepID=UPI0006F60654|nr:hypothetical protein [Sphingobium sp. Leaf26]KQN09827.1 hypothetical protein ASE85_02515 [Sphingobium sp. Leaf26]
MKGDLYLARLPVSNMPVSPQLFGYCGTGIAADDDVFALWAEAIRAGRSGYIPAGRYRLTRTVDLRGYDVSIDCHPNAIFDASTADSANLIQGAIFILGGGEAMTRLPDLAANIIVDAQTVTFATVPALAPKDIFVVYDSADYSWSASRNYYRAGEMMRTLSVAGAVVTIDAPAARAYATGGTREVWKLTMKKVRWSGGQFIGNPAYTGGVGLSVFQGENIAISNIAGGTGNVMALLALRRCYGGVVDNLTYWDASPDSAVNYATSVIACHDVAFRNPNVRSTRHAIAFTGGNVALSIPNRWCTVEGGFVSGGLYALDMHGSNDRCGFRDVQVRGGIQLAGRGPWVDGCRVVGNMAASSDPGACIRTTDEILDANISIKNVKVDDEGTKRALILIQSIREGGLIDIHDVQFVADSTIPDFVVSIDFATDAAGSVDIVIDGVKGQSPSGTCPIVQVNVPVGIPARLIRISDIAGAAVRCTAYANLIDVSRLNNTGSVIEDVVVNLRNDTDVRISNIHGRRNTPYVSNAMIAVRGNSTFAGIFTATISDVQQRGTEISPVVTVELDVASTGYAKSIILKDIEGAAPRILGRCENGLISRCINSRSEPDGCKVTLFAHTARQRVVIESCDIQLAKQCGILITGPGSATDTIVIVRDCQSMNNNQSNTASTTNAKSSLLAQTIGTARIYDNEFGDDQAVATQTRVDAIVDVGNLIEHSNRVTGTLTTRTRTTIGAWRAPSVLTASAAYNPPNLVDGDGATTTVAVVGAAVGDVVQMTFSLDLQGIILAGWCSAAGTISARFQNETGGAIDLASGTLTARVQKL